MQNKPEPLRHDSRDPHKIMQYFFIAFCIFCAAACLIIFDESSQQYIALFGLCIVIPSFAAGMYFYLQLLKLRFKKIQIDEDPFSQEADPQQIEKELLAKRKKTDTH